MSLRISLPFAIALGLLATPALAQPTQPPPDRDRTMEMNRDARMHDMDRHHDRMNGNRMDRDRMDRMDRRGSDWRTMRWCRSMSYRRMMRNSRCRWMMHRHHDRMHRM
jgi:hypothetical protein